MKILKLQYLIVFALIVFFTVGALLAQVSFGRIVGTVRDPVGAIVPGVSISVVNQATNAGKSVLSGDFGSYEVTHLPPGRYRVTAELPGFKRFVHQDVEVDAFSVVRIDVHLEVGEVSEQVTVSAGAPVIESDTPTVAQSRTFRQLRDLPVNIRGTNPLYQWTWLTPTAVQGGGSRRTFGGSRASMTYFNVDGISSNSTAFGNQLADLNPSQESLQEIRFDYVLPKAEFGEIGNVTAITKSGGNDLHGSLFWYNIHSALAARNFFAPTRGPVDPQTGEELFTQNNQVGGSFGGPVVRDKIFFFFSYEYNRDSSPAVITPNVPTAKMRQGDFSELLNLSKPVQIKNPFTGEPFPDNKIPGDLLYPGSIGWQERFYPEPNFGPSDSFNKNYRSSFSQLEQDHKFVNRTDFHLTPNHTLYGRVMYNRVILDRLTGLPPTSTGFSDLWRSGTQIAISDTWTLSPNFINEFKVSYSERFASRKGNRVPDGTRIEGQPLVDLLGVQGLPPAPGGFKIPDVRITGFTGVDVADANDYVEETYQVSDNMTWVRDRHTFKMGAGWLPQRYTSWRVPNYGRYDFGNTFTGFSYADFLLGLPLTTFRETERDTVYNRYYFLHWFFQDDFKVTARFTLNYGIRWDYNSPHHDKFDIYSSFDPVTGSVVVPTEEARQKIPAQFPSELPVLTADEAGFFNRGLRRPDRNNFSPRLGFAFRPFSQGRTVIRGGYGIFYDDFTGGVVGNQLFSGPFNLTERFRNRVRSGAPELTLQRPFLERGSLGTIELRFNSRELVNPYSQQWNLTFEQDIGFHTGLRISYIGVKTTQIPFRRNINQPPASLEPFDPGRLPYPLFGELEFTENGGNQVYHGLALNVERKMRDGLYFQTNWTWAKNLGDVDDDGNVERGTLIENQFCRACERGDSRYTPRHRFIANLIWELPAGRQKRFLSQGGPLGHILGGWKVTTTFIGQTGEHLTPRFTGADPSNTDTFGGRPDRIADGNLPEDQRSIQRWFDAAAFAVPTKGHFGNGGKGTLVGPGRATFDFGLFKYFQVSETGRFRVQLTATNVFNHPNFNAPNLNISAPGSVARIDSIYDRSDFAGPREIMIGLRYEF